MGNVPGLGSRAEQVKPRLPFLDFRQCFAIDAERSGGSCLQTANADLHATGVTEAVIILVDQINRLVNLLISFRSRSRVRSSRLNSSS